jgi:hypothetical protein
MLTTDITFEKIIEKTKRMLGKNYKGDEEIIPVQSEPAPIEGHTDAFLSVSNGGFTDEEVALIKEKTKNYAWWIANKGYLMDDTQREIPVLFIQGSEIGSISPDVLNFNGLTENNFYLPINRTNILGEIDHSSNHIYVQFILNGEIIQYETDINGTNSGLLEIDGVTYKFYSGRLYPEDRVVSGNNIVYPVYLISNLDYYYIPNIGEVGEPLEGAHDTQPTIKNNLEILEDVCEMVIHEAAQWTNRMVNTTLMNECWPVIVKCSCIAYLNRGAEGLDSQSELGQKNTYNDWVALMHKQITNRRYVI